MTWGQLQAAISGVTAPQPIPILTLAGTWSDVDQGFQAEVAQGVDQDKFYWVPVVYDASFGPIPGGPSAGGTALSYQESVAQGVTNTIAAINGISGKFTLGGYSQGAEVASRVLIDILTGSLQHRLADFVGGFTFGNPCRELAKGISETGQPAPGHGISSIRISGTPSTWLDCGHTGDMYANVPAGVTGDDITAVYSLVTDLQFHDIISMAQQMAQAFSEPGGLGQQIEQLLTNPLTIENALEAAGIAIGFVATNPPCAEHGNYDVDNPLGDGRSSLQIAIDHMNSLVA